jgi:plastocyanin
MVRGHLIAACFPLTLWLLGLAAKPAHTHSSWGSIEGVIRFTGTPTGPKQIMVSDGSTIEHRDLELDAKTQGLFSVAVFLEDAPAQPKLKTSEPVVVDQRDWVFLPRVVAVHHGQAVRFDNSDKVNHAVQATSLVKANQFNSVAAPGHPLTHAFEAQKGPVMIGCPLHPWMRAWLYVLPHPWFAVTDRAGKFHIKDVPAGKYRLLMVHPDTNLREHRPIEVQAGKCLEVHHTWDKVPQ